MGLQPGLLTGAATELKQDDILTALALLNSNTPTDFYQEVSLGNIAGQSSVATAGNNPGLPANVQESVNNIRLETGTGSLYPYLTADTTVYVSSSSASDTQVIGIDGLDATYNPVFRLATLNGQTPVVFSGTIFRIKSVFMIPGPLSVAVGNIYVSTDNTDITDGVPNTLSKVLAKIDKDFTQGVTGQFTIPAGKTGYLFNVLFNSSKAADAEINLRFKLSATGDPTLSPPFQTFQSSVGVNERIGIALGEKIDIDVVAKSPTAGSKITVAFNTIVIDP